MPYSSTSFDPLSDRDFQKETLPMGAWILRNGVGEIVKTEDVLGVRREYAREALTRILMVRKLGVWTRLEAGIVDQSGTLFYKQGDVEIQEKLNGVHVHTNMKTGVAIQNDQINHCEIMRQANGEVWKREVDEERELFEMWSNGALRFRSRMLFEPIRLSVDTPSGKQPLSYVVRVEESFASGLLTRQKFAFRNPVNCKRSVTITVPVEGKLMTLKNVESVVTTYEEGAVLETVFHLNSGTNVKVDIGGKRRDLCAVERVRQASTGQGQVLAFATTAGAEAVFTT